MSDNEVKNNNDAETQMNNFKNACLAGGNCLDNEGNNDRCTENDKGTEFNLKYINKIKGEVAGYDTIHKYTDVPLIKKYTLLSANDLSTQEDQSNLDSVCEILGFKGANQYYNEQIKQEEKVLNDRLKRISDDYTSTDANNNKIDSVPGTDYFNKAVGEEKSKFETKIDNIITSVNNIKTLRDNKFKLLNLLNDNKNNAYKNIDKNEDEITRAKIDLLVNEQDNLENKSKLNFNKKLAVIKNAQVNKKDNITNYQTFQIYLLLYLVLISSIIIVYLFYNIYKK